MRGAGSYRDNSGSQNRANNYSPLTKEALAIYLSIHKLEKQKHIRLNTRIKEQLQIKMKLQQQRRKFKQFELDYPGKMEQVLNIV